MTDESRILSVLDSELYIEKRKQELLLELQNLEKQVEQAKRDYRRVVEQAMKDMGLVKTTLVVFDLPSEYRNMTTRYEKTEYGKVQEIRTFNVNPAVYRSLRGKFYDELHICAYRTKAGWVLIEKTRDVCIKELNSIINELNELAETDRAVEIIETYMPKEFLINELEDYIEYLRGRVQSINTKIEDPEVSQRYKKQLLIEKEFTQIMIQRLTSLVEDLRGEKK